MYEFERSENNLKSATKDTLNSFCGRVSLYVRNTVGSSNVNGFRADNFQEQSM